MLMGKLWGGEEGGRGSRNNAHVCHILEQVIATHSGECCNLH